MKGDFFVMKSFCIKTNNKKIIQYLLKNLENINMEHTYISHKEFRLYHNIIIHYSGDSISEFYNKLCDILLEVILQFYEPMKLKEIINLNYFYFSEEERNKIVSNCLTYLSNDSNIEKEIRKEHIYISLLKYLDENKSMILEGFATFRLSNYMKLLDYVIDTCVNSFIIEREYNEFISLLKIYIDSKETTMDVVHLIYMNGESILIDSDKNIISVQDNIFNAKYLSDITFSSNDFALNTLLTILPKKIIIHVIDIEDEFIQTLKLIFDNRISLCSHCSICTTYRMLQHSMKS